MNVRPPTLMVVETEGAADISAEARAEGWTPLFVRTDAYASWLPAADPSVGETLYEPAPDFYALYRMALKHGAAAVLPISLLEPESLRDALLRDLAEHASAPFTVLANRPAPVELTFDKALTKRVLADAGFAVIPGRLANSGAELLAAAEEFGFPLVAKPRRDFTGKGFRIFHDRAAMDAYLVRSRVRELLVEPFQTGSELSLELVRWNGHCVAQPVVYKGETRLNPLEHPVYRPRLSPWRRGTALERQVVEAGKVIAATLGLEGACEVEFVVVDGEPRVMEVNPRVSGVTRLCSAGGGANTFRLLARLAMGLGLEEPRQRPGEIAVNLPIIVAADDPRVLHMRGHAAVRYVKPIDWMPALPIKGSVLLQAGSLGDLRDALVAMGHLSSPAYLAEMNATLDTEYVAH